MDNKHRGWAQGYFVNQRQYNHMNEEWKDEQRRREAFLVRPSPTGNAICQCESPEAAAWIAERLNRAADLEAFVNRAFVAHPNLDMDVEAVETRQL